MCVCVCVCVCIFNHIVFTIQLGSDRNPAIQLNTTYPTTLTLPFVNQLKPNQKAPNTCPFLSFFKRWNCQTDQVYILPLLPDP